VLSHFEATPSISGFLKKKSGSIKVFQKRYFCLSGQQLYYFKSPLDFVVRGCIDFGLWGVELLEAKDIKKFGLKMEGLKRQIWLKGDSGVQAEAWKAVLRGVIQRSNGVGKIKGSMVKKWWKGVSIDYGIFMRVADSGDLLVVEKEGKKEFHYALVVRHFDDQKGFLVFSYDWEEWGHRLVNFKEFYKNTKKAGYTKWSFRKVFSHRDVEFFERQKTFFESDPELMMNTMKAESSQFFNRLQLHSLLENQKCYCMNMVETYFKCMKILPMGKIFSKKSDLLLKDTKKIKCSVPMKITNIK
jgi:hypothetical protein